MLCSLALIAFKPTEEGMEVALTGEGAPRVELTQPASIAQATEALARAHGICLTSGTVDAGVLEVGGEIWLVRAALGTLEASSRCAWQPGRPHEHSGRTADLVRAGRMALSRLLRRQPICAVVGCKATSRHYNDDVRDRAAAAGRMAAELGFAVLTGGLGGVMADAAWGARSAGGPTLGILPGEVHADANPHARFVLPSGIGYARNYLVALGCDCMVALPGGRGTLEEMCFALDFERLVLSWGSFAVDEAESVAPEDAGTITRRLDRWMAQAFTREWPSLTASSNDPCTVITS